MTELQLQAIGLTLNDWATFSPEEKLYLDISELLAEIAELRWVDLEAGQLEIPMEEYPVQFPCGLVDFPSSEYQDETHGNQAGLMNITIRLAVDMYEDLHMIDGATAPDRGAGVKGINIKTKIHQKLHGMETDYSSPMVRTSVQTERRDDGLKVWAINYQCAVKDDSAARLYNSYTGAVPDVDKG